LVETFGEHFFALGHPGRNVCWRRRSDVRLCRGWACYVKDGRSAPPASRGGSKGRLTDRVGCPGPRGSDHLAVPESAGLRAYL